MPQSNENLKVKEVQTSRGEKAQNPAERLESVRKDLALFVKNYRQFQANYPEIDRELSVAFPRLHQDVDELMSLAEELGKPDPGLLERYNSAARRVNEAFASLNRDRQVSQDPLHAALNSGESLKLTDAQKAETSAFARALFKKVFPESNVSQTVRLATGQRALEDYQKVLVAPAEGIETAVMGFINLFKPQTYRDLNDGVQTACGMSYEEWCMAWKMLKSVYENASGADVAEVSISFIVTVSFLIGGVSKLGQISKGMKMPAYLMPAVEAATVGSRGAHYGEKLKALPAGVLGGLVLKYESVL